MTDAKAEREESPCCGGRMKTLVNEKTIDIIIDGIQDIYESEATWDEDYGIPLLSRKGYEQLEVLLAEYV